MIEMHGTTILVLRKNGKTVMAGDGQITLGETIMKGTARKVRKLGDGRVLAGFAGSVADAMTLFEKFEFDRDFTVHRLDPSKFEHHSDWFKAINPRGQVPALDDGGRRLVAVEHLQEDLTRRLGIDLVCGQQGEESHEARGGHGRIAQLQLPLPERRQ